MDLNIIEQEVGKIAPGSTVTFNDRTKSLTLLVKSRYADTVSEYIHSHIPANIEVNIIEEDVR